MTGKPIQFLDAKSRGEAERLWHAVLRLEPVGAEEVPVEQALGRVLAEDLLAPVELPPFDRSVVDGYALVAADSFAAREESPARIRLRPERCLAGVDPGIELAPGAAVEIATGGVLPRGADAVQMIERTDLEGDTLLVHAPVVPGQNLQTRGSDLRKGELVFTSGTVLGAKETGVLAALGLTAVGCRRCPRVAVLSTGDEIVPPGTPLGPGQIHDANARVIGDALREIGAVVEFLGVVPDDEAKLEAALAGARGHDAVVLSGGTSKGTGDLSFRLIDRLGKPGVVVHGVKVKPGKPVVLAAWDGKPVVVLPGFPSSAILTFNLFVRPVVRILAGLAPREAAATREAVVAVKMQSAPGRYEYVLVALVGRGDGTLAAYPVGKSSGSIAAFAEADGYLEVPEDRDLLHAGERAEVTLLRRDFALCDLVVAGSPCPAMDLLLRRLRVRHGVTVKRLPGGGAVVVAAVVAGDAAVASVERLDRDGRYNREAIAEAGETCVLVRGWRRRQGIVYRAADFAAPPTFEAIVLDPARRLVNRGRGSGARVLLDLEVAALAGSHGVDPDALVGAILGYESAARTHAAVANEIAAGRADWGIASEAAAIERGLGFVALRDEEVDLLVSRARLDSQPVKLLLAELGTLAFRAAVEALPGYVAPERMGETLPG